MFKLLKKSLFGKKASQQATAFSSVLHPQKTTYAIGDIHGRADLLEQLLDRIEEDAAQRNSQNANLVFLGDYVDRGDYSAEVLARLHDLSKGSTFSVACLMGNHERMMLDFLDTPETGGPRWMRSGGLQTLASFRIGGVSEQATPEQFVIARDKLRQILPEGREMWLRGLLRYWQSGNVICAHAGMDPALEGAHQTERNCIWGHPDFLKKPRQDGQWVIYGHITTEHPGAQNGRISIDTGAYFSGHLTAAIVEPENLEFLMT